MPRKIATSLGKYEYEPGLLERFIEELSGTWGVELSELQPAQEESKVTGHYAGYGVHLARKNVNSEDKTIIKYERSPSDNVCDTIEPILKKGELSDDARKKIHDSLYGDNIVSAEFSHIKRRDKVVDMFFVQGAPQGVKEVYIRTVGLDEALEEANTQSPIFNMDHLKKSCTVLRFAGSASKNVNEVRYAKDLEVNPIEDMQNACNFVRAYLGK